MWLVFWLIHFIFSPCQNTAAHPLQHQHWMGIWSNNHLLYHKMRHYLSVTLEIILLCCIELTSSTCTHPWLSGPCLVTFVTLWRCVEEFHTGGLFAIIQMICYKSSQLLVSLLLAHTSRIQLRLLFDNMITSSNGNIFRVTPPLWGESTGHR